MQQGEIIVARLRGGPTIGRCLDPPVPSSKGGARSVRVSMGRNREARLPVERVALATGVAAERDEEVEELRRQSEGLSADIDLSEVWGVVREEASALTLDEIAELHWELPADTARRIALCLYLEREQVFFASEGSTYSPRSADEVEELLSRQRRREENRAASAALVDALSRGELPTDPSDHQKTLLNHLREYAVHGDSYTRSAVAQGILAQVQRETRDLQRLAFELLVETGALSADEPLELDRAGVPREFPRDAVAAAADLSAETAVREALRTDLTGVEAFTVDDEETRDRDDALSLEVLEPTGFGEAVYRLGVHITDAGALIPAGGALDREADRRMATLYLPDRKIPMLPPEVSSGKGSLTPGETRPAMSLMMRVTASGNGAGPRGAEVGRQKQGGALLPRGRPRTGGPGVPVASSACPPGEHRQDIAEEAGGGGRRGDGAAGDGHQGEGLRRRGGDRGLQVRARQVDGRGAHGPLQLAPGRVLHQGEAACRLPLAAGAGGEFPSGCGPAGCGSEVRCDETPAAGGG